MTVPDVAPTSPAGMYTTQQSRTPKQEMDSEVFLSLLVTQLRNQDPSSPMDSNQMIAQTTQLAMMEQLTSLASTSTNSLTLQQRATAAALLGQLVQYVGSDGTTASGIASAVAFTADGPALTIDGTTVSLGAVIGVGSAPTAS